MNKANISDMTGGWFIGSFMPAVLTTENFEVGIKKYKKGDYEESHLHKIAVEITAIVSGKVRMKGIEYKEGDIITINPGESTDFLALTDVTNVVIKTPSILGDKYLTEGLL